MCARGTQLLALLAVGLVRADYFQDRTQFLQDESRMFLGGDLQLSPKEQEVNKLLMADKVREYDGGFHANLTFPPARHFFQAKSDIDQSNVFKFIQKLPKGALLHGHDFALVSTEYLVKNITYRENLYMCVNAEDVCLLHFFLTPDDTCDWVLVSDQRISSGNVTAFDDWLGQKLTLVVSDPAGAYSDINVIWSTFGNIFASLFGLLSYRPAFVDYFNQVLTEFYQDNVMYIEFRAIMSPLYELDGTENTPLETATLYQTVTQRFVQEHPGFLGARVIYAPSRAVGNNEMLKYLDTFKTLRSALPEFVAGFDLVGQEDLGTPLLDLIETILKFQQDGAHFFFHAGETNWQGETDLNLIDAVLLNTTRIGHGYAMNKHPLVMKLVKERGIAIEVNPVSNQVLMLVSDLRNHPAAALMADNYPVVIAADDPSLWGAKGLSYDFYEAFMGLAGISADLRTLKQLAINSIKYSAMPSEEKARAMTMWEKDWDTFLNAVLQTHTNELMPPKRISYNTGKKIYPAEINDIRIELA